MCILAQAPCLTKDWSPNSSWIGTVSVASTALRDMYEKAHSSMCLPGEEWARTLQRASAVGTVCSENRSLAYQ